MLGFAEHLAQLLNLQPAEKIVFTPPSRWLVIGGSLHPLALEQLDFAAQKGIPQVILSPAFFFEDNIEDFFKKLGITCKETLTSSSERSKAEKT